MRIALAALAGFALWTAGWFASNALWRRLDPAAYAAGGVDATASLRVLASSALLSLLAGGLAGRIGGGYAAVWLLAAVQLAVGALVTATSWRVAPWWYHALFLLLLVPLHLLGARLALGGVR